MPTTSRLFVKASVVYLCLGAAIGSLLLINRWLPLGPAVATLRTSHIQFLLTGWLTQLILGVAWWLFPPLALGLHPDAPKPSRRGQAQRGSEPLFWVTFACLNAGILLAAIADPLYALTQVRAFSALTGVSGLLLLAAAVTAVLNMWGRIRALGRGR
jgi:uncharacterized membrane protein YqgA involved in biofilm formation